MPNSDSTVRFVDDERAVSAVVGAILMFGILVLALTTYQAAIVPEQNAQTEFDHFEDNRDELIEFRNAVSTAGQTDVSQFPSIKLGTQYQSRTFTINPPPPAGTLQTSDPYNITIVNKTGTRKNVSTRFVEYRPGYREISVGSTWYEHSVLYLDERESGGQSIIEDQDIVTSSGTVRITALQNEFQSTKTGRVSVELYPTNGSEFPDFDGNVTVKIPSRLNGTDYWDDELGDYSVYSRSESYPGEDDVYRVVLDVDSDDLEMNTVGIQDEPTEGSVNNVPAGSGGQNGDGGDDGTEINPASPSDVRFDSSEWNNKVVTMTFNNTGEDINITEARVSFYFRGSGSTPPDSVKEIGSQDLNPDWNIGGDFNKLDSKITLNGNGNLTDVAMKFNGNTKKQDFFVVTFIYNNGGRGTYFIGNSD